MKINFQTLLISIGFVFFIATGSASAVSHQTAAGTLNEELQILIKDVQNIALSDFLEGEVADEETVLALEERTYALIEKLQADSDELTDTEKKLSADKVAQCLQVLSSYTK